MTATALHADRLCAERAVTLAPSRRGQLGFALDAIGVFMAACVVFLAGVAVGIGLAGAP